MGPDPHTKSMTHTNCVEFARFLQKEVPHKMHGGHTKCIVATQNTRHFLLESFVWEEAIHVTFLKDPPAKVAPIRNEKGVISQSFWYL